MKRASLLLLLLLSTAAFAKAQSLTGYTNIGNVSVTAFTDSTCPDGSSCSYQISAVDSIGVETCCSNIAVALVPKTGTHTVALTWVASGTSGVTYNVYRHIGPLAPSALSAVVN